MNELCVFPIMLSNLVLKSLRASVLGRTSMYTSKDYSVPCKEVSRRWTNLRDAYCKSRKKIQNCKRSGTGASTVKKYIFNNQMQFLEKCYDSRDTEESVDYSVTTEIDNTESIHEKPDEYENTGEIIKEVNVPANRMIRRRRKPDEVDAAVLKASEQPQQQPDTNMSFFHSLKPHLKQFDDSQILQFQIAVLEIISEIKEKEKMTQAPAFPTIPQYCCSHVPLRQQSPKPLSHQHHSSLRCCMQQHHPYNSYHSLQECGIQTNVTPSSTTELSQYNQPIYQSLNITPKVVSGNKPISCTSGQILTSTQTSQPVIISETASNYECFGKTSDDNTSLSIIRVDSPFSDNSETFDFGN